MTDLRTPLAIAPALLAITLAAGLAAAQPSPPPPDGDTAPVISTEPEPRSDPRSASAPQSPEEEAARRAERLDGLFVLLARPDNPAWEAVQGEIWSLWSHSGSPSMDLLLSRAAKAMERKDFDHALRFLDDLVRLAPDFAEGWNKRATVHYLREDYGRSVADIQRTLALEPRHFGAIYGLGAILERTGDKKGALTAYRRGLEINPHLPGAQEAVERLAPEVDGREL